RWAAVSLLVAGVCEFGVAQTATAPASQSTTESSQPATGPAQPGASKSGQDADSDIPRIRVGINEVNVVFTVTDRHGKRVTDLKQNDFQFIDDNKPATEIRSFHAETNLPLQ